MNNLFERAKNVMPGGVNSPVRSFASVGIDPVFMDSAKGSKIYDISGNEYIDYICSWGPMILGHSNDKILDAVSVAAQKGLSFGAATKAEVDMAELVVSAVPNIDMVRMVNSGTEAVMSALRLAKAATGKDKIIKFEGCYHGHSDNMLVRAGSGALTFSNPDSKGVTSAQAQNTLIAQYNNLSSVEQILSANKGEVAAIIVEPVAANMGLVLPKADFLQGLRTLCDENNALLIFDEVITGFRLGLGGAQEFYGIKADIVTFGKIIGGGMPVGAYAANRELMQLIAPLGPVYQAGTLSGNPIAMAAGIAQLQELQDKKIYEQLEQSAKQLKQGFESVISELNVSAVVNQVASLVCVFFTANKVEDFLSAKSSDTELYAKYFRLMLEQGINLAPAQFEAMFISTAHTQDDLDKTINAFKNALQQLKANGDLK